MIFIVIPEKLICLENVKDDSNKVDEKVLFLNSLDYQSAYANNSLKKN